MTRRFYWLHIAIFSLLFMSCVHYPITSPQEALKPASRLSVDIHDDLDFENITEPIEKSLEFYRRLPQDTVFYFGPKKVAVSEVIETLQLFLKIVDDKSLSYRQKLKLIKKNFEFYKAVGSNGRGRVLFTGYYEPVVSCRLNADDKYKYPLYKRPDDIVEIDLTLFGNNFPVNRIFGRIDNRKVVPYFSRQEIDHLNALANKGLEILWCSDPVDIYFLQIQGSGKADLGNGKIISVLYDGQNGRPYRSIGKYLIDKGVMTKDSMSMQALREYLRSHPDEMYTILNHNPSYVFFRIDTGPSLGSIGQPLTPRRSIATDSRLFPKGALALIKTEKPIIENGAIKEWVPFARFVLNQDTGGAIKGPGRVDLFWGQGEEAEISAGYMQQEGELFFLLRKK